MKQVRNLFVAVILAGVATLGCDGQRDCPSEFSCAELVTLTCGEGDACSSAESCKAAKRLAADADQNACLAAWCSLGDSYRECD